jgi:glutamate 5-kinase
VERLFELGVVPIVNENDTVADDEIRYGDNDRLAALVANLVSADLLVLLTDTPGLFTADPRLDQQASLIEEISAVDDALEAVAGGRGSERGSGGMASKLAAAKIASWSGVRAVIAAADVPDVLAGALAGEAVGTVVRPHEERLSSRKLWIAFARPATGRIVVDDGARRALVSQGRSLLAAGVREVRGTFDVDDAVEVLGPDGRAFAKGLVRYDSAALEAAAGRRTSELADGAPQEVVHRDDLVVLP